MIKRVLAIILYSVIPLGIFILLGFAVESNRNIPCKNLFVEVKGNQFFVDSAYVAGRIISQFGLEDEKTIGEISLRNIEDLVSKIYYAESSQVYRTIDGDIKVNVKQREPIARVINSHNESFYIDSKGKLMKTSDRYTARVVVVTGYITARYSPNLDLYAVENQDEISHSQKVLMGLNELIIYINDNSFWNAWIDQVYVTRAGNFELVPKNGAHVIEFGKAENIDEKFNKLLLFYQNGLTHLGWNSYNRLNLKFKNQIVCSK